MRVRVYYNLNRNCLSVIDKTTRLVIKYVAAISLTNVKFIVSQKGIERIRRNKRRAVIAFVEGDVVAWHGMCFDDKPLSLVKFNPYQYDAFVYADTHRKVETAEHVVIKDKYVYTWNAK